MGQGARFPMNLYYLWLHKGRQGCEKYVNKITTPSVCLTECRATELAFRA